MTLRQIIKKIPGVTRIFGKKEQVLDKEAALDNLVHAKKLLDDLNVSNWLTDGTLLGYYRDGDFIGHDLDVDMGSFISDYTDEIIHKFIENGWRIEHIFGRKDIGFELAFIRKNLKLDIFFFYEDGDKYWHGAWKQTERGEMLIKYYYDKFELREIEFKNKKLNIPADPLKYIETKYGPEWQTPVKEWDWAFGPSNAVPTDFYMERL